MILKCIDDNQSSGLLIKGKIYIGNKVSSKSNSSIFKYKLQNYPSFLWYTFRFIVMSQLPKNIKIL
jgi:hypothetical protein